MKTCLCCGSPSGKYKFCKNCEREKHKASALVSQNTKKLMTLLRSRWITTKGYEKFLLYTDNIKQNGRVLMKYKAADELKSLIIVNNHK